MAISQMIYQIDAVIRNRHMPREKKIKNLQSLAMCCWQEVVPEFTNPDAYQKLESVEIQKRWASVRGDVEKYETRSEILYVLDWPATNGNFYWVK